MILLHLLELIHNYSDCDQSLVGEDNVIVFCVIVDGFHVEMLTNTEDFSCFYIILFGTPCCANMGNTNFANQVKQNMSFHYIIFYIF